MDRHRSDGADSEYGGPPLGGQQFLSYADMAERDHKSCMTIRRWGEAGLLPAPYEIGPNSRGFKLQEVEEHDNALRRKTYGSEVTA